MNTAAQIRPPRMPGAPQQPTGSRRSAGAPSSERRTVGEMLTEIVPLTESVLFDGPPVVFVLGPWLLLAFVLAGPVACLFALVVVILVAATALAAVAAALAAPYLLVRHFRRAWASHASISAPAAQLVAIESPRVAG